MNKFLIPLVLLSLTACKSSHMVKQDANQVIALTDVKIIDGTGTQPMELGVLVVEGEKILSVGPTETTKIPENAKVISLKGKVIMPGMVSNHNHIGSVDGMNVSLKNYTRENILKQLEQYRDYGVTTITSLGVNPELFYSLRAELHKGEVDGADIFGADKGIAAVKGAPPLPEEFSGPAVARAKTPQEARLFVREMKNRNTDLIKLWYDDFLGTLPKMKPEIYRAIIDEAHKQDLRVASHVYYMKDARDLVNAKTDILAHGIRQGTVDAAFINAMKKNNVSYIPTLGVDESFYIYGDHPEWLKDPFFNRALSSDLKEQIKNASKMKELLSNPTTDTRRAAVKNAQANLKKLFDGGVLIGFGTDSGANPWRIPGFAEHRELELMVQAGLTPLEAIQIATANGAKVLHLEDRGVLATGKRADFIVLGKDPSQNILNTRSIEAVWTRGVEKKIN